LFIYWTRCTERVEKKLKKENNHSEKNDNNLLKHLNKNLNLIRKTKKFPRRIDNKFISFLLGTLTLPGEKNG